MKKVLLLIQTQNPDNGSTMITDASDSLADGAQNIGAWLGLSGPILNIVGGILLLIIGYFISKFVGRLVKNLIQKTGVDDKTSGKASLSAFIGKLVYYLLMIIVLMATLSMMGVSGDVLAPLNAMTAKFFNAIPNIIAAGLIAYVGYFLAKILADLIEASGDKIRDWLPGFSTANDNNELDDNLNEVNRDFNKAASSTSNIDIVKILKNIAFIFIFIPILIIALEQLNMSAITVPATNMLNTFFNAIPNIIYAVVILLITVIGGKFLVNLLKDLLISFNINDLGTKLKLNSILGNTNLVNLIGNIAYIFIVYIGIVEAAKFLGLDQVVYVLDEILFVAGKIVFGLLILTLGNVVANFVTKIFLDNDGTNKFMASIIKGAILVIFLAMGLHAMGIADDIIELAFGLGLGAISVAFALSFGLGGREAAGEEVKHFFAKLKKDKKDDTHPNLPQ